jgi:uncharacterized protein YcbX
MSVIAHVSALYEYPLKSCRGHQVASSAFDRFGPVGDRRWMVVDGHGDFLTQRDLPAMAAVEATPTEHGLYLSAPGMQRLLVQRPQTGPPYIAAVWNDYVDTLDCGDDAAEWLGRYLDTPSRLVVTGPNYRRPVRRAGQGAHTSLADGYPFLLISEASLEDLNSRMDRPLSMDRFRPNIVVKDCPPYAEDNWAQFRIGTATFAAVKPCSRCAITTTDQMSGSRDGKEPLRTLAKYRRLNNDAQVFFGQNVVHLEAEGEIRVGDQVQSFA